MGKKRYEQLKDERENFLLRARRCSELTLPLVIRDEYHNKDTSDISFEQPLSSLGARGVNNLASKLLLALLAPNAPFFRLLLDSKAKREIQGMDEVQNEIDRSLADIER